MKRSPLKAGPSLRTVAVTALALSLTACSSGGSAPGPSSTAGGETGASASTSSPGNQKKSLEERTQEIEDGLKMDEPELVVTGKIPSGEDAFPAELAIIQVEATDVSTLVVFALRSTSSQENPAPDAFSESTPLRPDVRDLSLTDPGAEAVLRPFLQFPEDEAPTTQSPCLCSLTPKTLDETWFPLYATVPALAAGTSSVTVKLPGFDDVSDVPVIRR